MLSSIKNDATVVTTAAVSAGAANVVMQNAGKFKFKPKNINTGAIKDTIADTIKSSAKGKKVKVPKGFADKVKDFTKNINKEAFEKAMENTKANLKKLGIDTMSFGEKLWARTKLVTTTTNWKTVGKYAAIAGGIAAGVVLANKIFGKDDAE